MIEDRLRGPEAPRELVVVRGAPQAVDDPAFAAYVTAMAADIAALVPTSSNAWRPVYSTGDASLVSADRDAALIQIDMAGETEDAEEHIARVHAVTLDADAPDGIEVAQAGVATLAEDVNTQSEEDLAAGEAFGVPIALIVLLVVSGALVAAILRSSSRSSPSSSRSR